MRRTGDPDQHLAGASERVEESLLLRCRVHVVAETGRHRLGRGPADASVRIVELGVGLLIMTIVASFRLLVFYGAMLVPFIPLLKVELDKLQSVKADDFLRFIIWQDSLRVWSKQPILGVGPGDFWAYDQIFTKLPSCSRPVRPTPVEDVPEYVPISTTVPLNGARTGVP